MAEQQIQPGSTYRVKFRREQFIELVRIAQPKIIYRVKNMYFFSFDGFVMYTTECTNMDLSGHKIVEALEFSNMPWQKS